MKRHNKVGLISYDLSAKTLNKSKWQTPINFQAEKNHKLNDFRCIYLYIILLNAKIIFSVLKRIKIIMKKFSICIYLFMASLVTNAQLTKGTWLVGGNGMAKSYTSIWEIIPGQYSKWKITEINLSANIGYFPAEKLVLGLRPTFSSEKGNRDGGGGETNIKTIVIGPFARYYLLNSEKPFNIIAELSYSIGKFYDLGFKGQSNELLALTGPSIFFNNCISFELLAGYKELNRTVGTSYTEKGLQIIAGFQIHLER
jgi:hypothetical protein